MKTVVICGLYDGPHKELYLKNTEFLVGSHKEYCKSNGYDYVCLDKQLLTSEDLNGALTDEEIEYTTRGVMFGMYKWILTYYYTQILDYDVAVCVDYDTRFFNHDPFPEGIYLNDLGVSNPHSWSYVNASCVFFWNSWFDVKENHNKYEYWYNTGLFSVNKKFDYIDFLRDFINATQAIENKEVNDGIPFIMNNYTWQDHQAIFKSNDEIFLQVMLNKLAPICTVFDSNWNTGTVNDTTVLRHYTDKASLPNQLG